MEQESSAVRKSIVRVHFASSNTTLPYFNDSFDLQDGDIVFVDGKFEGQRGVVENITHNFKIRPSDYKRIISKGDTSLNGNLFMAGSHFVAFDRDVIPYEKILSWYKAPAKDDDDYLTECDDTRFSLDRLAEMHVRREVVERGGDYYQKNRVRYLCVDGTRGRAIVEGSKPYEVEFTLEGNEVVGLVCECFCDFVCKHDVAVLLQLRETLQVIRENYAASYENSGYFAAVDMGTVFTFAVEGKKNGGVRFGENQISSQQPLQQSRTSPLEGFLPFRLLKRK